MIDTPMHIWDTANGYEWLPLLANGALNHNFFMPDYLKMAQNQPISQMAYIECGSSLKILCWRPNGYKNKLINMEV